MIQKKVKMRRHFMLHLKTHLRFHFREHLKLYKVDGPPVGAIESAPESILKQHLRINLEIYIMKS